MKLVVFGANGKVGRPVVQHALERGHNVAAFVHNRSDLTEHPNLKLIHGDVHDPVAVEKSLVGTDAVISALGSWGTKNKDVLAAAMQHIVPAMKRLGISRIVSLTGFGATMPGESLGFIATASRPVLNMFMGKIIDDGEKHLKLLYSSDLNWSVVRSPVMNSIGRPDRYVLSTKSPAAWSTINRESVAIAMLDLAVTDKFNQQAPFISRS